MDKSQKAFAWWGAATVVATILSSLLFGGCGGSGAVTGPDGGEQARKNAAQSSTTTVALKASAINVDIRRDGDFLVVIIEGAGAPKFVEVYNKDVDGTVRTGHPALLAGPYGNGTWPVDVSSLACHDLQADAGGFSKQFARWGECPVYRRPSCGFRNTIGVTPTDLGTGVSFELSVSPYTSGHFEVNGLIVLSPFYVSKTQVLQTLTLTFVTANGCADTALLVVPPARTPIDPPPPSPDPSPTPIPPPPPPPPTLPPVGACYYRVSCGGQATGGHSSCSDRGQQVQCEAAIGGNPTARGIWLNYGDQALLNHCRFTVPGLVNGNFQLNPGQSADGCFDKNGHVK